MGRVQHLDDESSSGSGSAPRKKRRADREEKAKASREAEPAKPAAKPLEIVASDPTPLPRLPTGSDIPEWLRDEAPPGFNPGLNPALAGMSPFSGMPGFAAPSAGMSGFGFADLEALGGTSKVDVPRMDFSKPTKDDLDTTTVVVHKELVGLLMTAENKTTLEEETGAGIEWDADKARVQISGSPEQVQRAQRLLSRVTTHNRWGQSADKIRRCIKPRKVESILCRLSAMGTLPAVQKTLNSTHSSIKMGKGPENHVILPNPYKVVSRTHCVLEYDEERGAVYIYDCSTNGTFLNQRRLPPKANGKILLSHGDELMFKDPLDGTKHEFGYMVNLEEISSKKEVSWAGPRRLFSPEEITRLPGDLR